MLDASKKSIGVHWAHRAVINYPVHVDDEISCGQLLDTFGSVLAKKRFMSCYLHISALGHVHNHVI